MADILALGLGALQFLVLFVVFSLAVVGATALAVVISVCGEFLGQVVKTWRH